MLKAENEQGNVRESKNPQQKRHISQINERGLKILVDAFNKRLTKAKKFIII